MLLEGAVLAKSLPSCLVLLSVLMLLLADGLSSVFCGFVDS